MIRFICSSNLFEQELRNILIFEIDYLSPKEGILLIDSKDINQLDYFCIQLAQDRGIILTCLDCYGQDELTTQALKFAHRFKSSRLHRLSNVLFGAMLRNEKEVLDEIDYFLKHLEGNLLEFAKTFIENQGNALMTADYLYVHRNTINNRLNNFYDQTGIDLRVKENQKVIELLINYQNFS